MQHCMNHTFVVHATEHDGRDQYIVYGQCFKCNISLFVREDINDYYSGNIFIGVRMADYDDDSDGTLYAFAAVGAKVLNWRDNANRDCDIYALEDFPTHALTNVNEWNYDRFGDDMTGDYDISPRLHQHVDGLRHTHPIIVTSSEKHASQDSKYAEGHAFSDEAMVRINSK